MITLGNDRDGLANLAGTRGSEARDMDEDGDLDEDDYSLLYDMVAGVGP